MTQDLSRFSVAMPTELLGRFDELVERRGLGKNRSEVIRDLVREALVEEECSHPNAQVVATLTISFDHHVSDLTDKLHDLQHAYTSNVTATLHIHLDRHSCLEVIVLRGTASLVRRLADAILGAKGVKNGKLVLTSAEGLV